MKKKSLLIIATIFLFGGFLLKGQVIQSDSLALVDFYNSTDGPNWKAVGHNWLTGNVSTWAGIGVTGERVISINLEGLNGLVGAGDTVNNFNGTLNASLGNLSELTTLMLNGSESKKIYIDIHGSIPAEIWNLSKLTKLQFKYLRLTEWNNRNDISKLKSLIEFNTQATLFGGSLPDSLFTIPTIQKLYLHSCNYTGAVPATLVKATKLTRLYLWGGSRLTALPYVNITNKGAAKLELNDNYFTFAEIKAYADSSAKYSDFSKNTRQLKQEDTIQVSGYEGYSYKFSEKVTDGTYYKWYKEIVQPENLVSSDSTYSIATLSAIHQGNYICEVEDTAVKNINGTGTVTPFRIVVFYTLAVNPPPAPMLESAATDVTGTKINLSFDKAMVNPAAFVSNFSVKVNGADATIKKISLDASDSKVFVIELTNAVSEGDVILLSYSGIDVTAEDNGVLDAITDQSVTNNVNTTGISDFESNLSVYPNPFTDKLFITSKVKIDYIGIYNITGKMVLELKNLNESVISVPVADLPQGIYMISIQSTNSTAIQKIVKK